MLDRDARYRAWLEPRGTMKPAYHIACAIAACPLAASAEGGAYQVDDAGIVDSGVVQVESWYISASHDHQAMVVNPAYQLLPDTEFSLQTTHDYSAGDRTDSAAPEVKYQWLKASEPGGISSAIAVGFTYTFDQEQITGGYLYVPVTFNLTDQLEISADLGGGYARTADQHVVTWGIGGTYHATEMLSFIGEVFGQDKDTPAIQAGPHLKLMPGLEVDAIYGENIYADHGQSLIGGFAVSF